MVMRAIVPKAKPYAIIIIFIFLVSSGLFGGGGETKNNKGSSNALSPEIADLIEEMNLAININNDMASFDSLANLAISKAENTYNIDQVLQTNLNYLELVENSSFNTLDFESIVKKTEALALKKGNNNFAVWLALSNSSARLNKAKLAHSYALKSFSEVNLSKNVALKVKAYLALGQSLKLTQQYLEAFQNYLNAKYQIELVSNPAIQKQLKKACYDQLYIFFDELQDFDQAAEYKYKHIQLIIEEEKIDSLALMWAKLDMVGVDIRANKFKDLHHKFDEILAYAEHIGNNKLHEYTLTVYRTYLIDAHDSKGFHYLYHERFPEELDAMSSENPVLYYRIKAHISEYEGDFAAADGFYKQAENLVMQSENNVYQSNYYRRYGQFLYKHGHARPALNAFQKSYDLAATYPYLEYMVQSSAYLDTISFKLGDLNKAYIYSKIHHDLKSEKEELSKDGEFMLMNLQNESKRMELKQIQEKEKQKNQYNLQYLLITIFISILMIILVIASQLRVPVWVIKGMGFLGVLMIFEFLILLLDHEIHHMTHGAPLWIFIIKVTILFILFPLHHLAEKAVISYMLEKKLVVKPKKGSFKKFAHTIWPWMKE